MATVTAIYRPFLVAVRNTAIGTHGGGGVWLYECSTKPLLQKFPNLHPYGALNQANMVTHVHSEQPKQTRQFWNNFSNKSFFWKTPRKGHTPYDVQ